MIGSGRSLEHRTHLPDIGQWNIGTRDQISTNGHDVSHWAEADDEINMLPFHQQRAQSSKSQSNRWIDSLAADL